MRLIDATRLHPLKNHLKYGCDPDNAIHRREKVDVKPLLKSRLKYRILTPFAEAGRWPTTIFVPTSMNRVTMVGSSNNVNTPRTGSKAANQGVDSRYTYQQTSRYFAQVAEGLEAMSAGELSSLGATDVHMGYRGFFFHADRATLYRITYQSRFIQKIVAPLSFFDCHSTKYLYRRAKEIGWTELLRLDKTFAIVSNVSNSTIRHSKYAALCVKDAIIDSFKEQFDRRPNIDTKQPDVWLNLHITKDRATIGLEVSGGSLHKRGYRIETHKAPMQETLAAAITDLSEWAGERPWVDPMCGSGTLLCEALMRYCQIPAGYLRRQFGFEALPDFDAQIWNVVKREADAALRPLPAGLIAGSDISAQAIDAARVNLAQLPYGPEVDLKQIDFRDIKSLGNRTIVANPPHGLRLQKREGLDLFCKDLGDFLKQRCTGSTAYLYFGDRDLIKRIGLRTTWKIPLASGGVDGRLVKLELY